MIILICMNLWQLTYHSFTIQLSVPKPFQCSSSIFIQIDAEFFNCSILIFIKCFNHIKNWIHENKQLSIHGFVSGSDTNWRNLTRDKQRNLKFSFVGSLRMIMNRGLRILPLVEFFSFHEQLEIRLWITNKSRANHHHLWSRALMV